MNPSFVDLRPNLDVVEDQGIYGACTGFGGAKWMDVVFDRAGLTRLFSPMYLWAKERIDAGTWPQNVGVSPAEIFLMLKKYGVCLESTMPNSVPIDFVPTAAMDAEAVLYKIDGYTVYGMDADGKVTLERVKTSVAKGVPVLATIYVKQSLFAVTGPWTTHDWNAVLDTNNPNVGLHQIVLIGYSDPATRTLAQTSWGPNFGDGGFFGIPYPILSWNEICQFAVFIEMRVPGVRFINAGWRPDLTPAQIAVQQAYVAYFGRPADLAGLNYWAGALASEPLSIVLDAFATSAESHALYQNATTSSVINAAYMNLFGHAPDGPGLAYWTHLVDSGELTLGGVIFSILQGALGTDAESVAAKVEAAGVLTFDEDYATEKIPTARAWLSAVITKNQVQSAVEALP